jgi:hypothetical protein
MTQDNLTAEDRETWGEDLVHASQRWAEPVVRAHVGQLQQQLNQVTANQERMRLDATRRSVIDALDRDPPVPDWRRVNDDPRFVRWLDKVDPLSGQKLIDMLRRAFDMGDTARIRVFFTSWAASQLPQRQRTPHREPFEGGGRRQPTINSSDLTRGKLWTRDQITKFYNDCRRGAYDGREGERLKIEAEILRAGRENRVANPVMREYWQK